MEKTLSHFLVYNKHMTKNCTQHTSAMQYTFLNALEEFLVYGKHTVHHFVE